MRCVRHGRFWFGLGGPYWFLGFENGGVSGSPGISHWSYSLALRSWRRARIRAAASRRVEREGSCVTWRAVSWRSPTIFRTFAMLVSGAFILGRFCWPHGAFWFRAGESGAQDFTAALGAFADAVHCAGGLDGCTGRSHNSLGRRRRRLGSASSGIFLLLTGFCVCENRLCVGANSSPLDQAHDTHLHLMGEGQIAVFLGLPPYCFRLWLLMRQPASLSLLVRPMTAFLVVSKMAAMSPVRSPRCQRDTSRRSRSGVQSGKMRAREWGG